MDAGMSPGPWMGKTLKLLLEEVIIDPGLNNPNYLLERAMKLKETV
jgi:hypothetical protein